MLGDSSDMWGDSWNLLSYPRTGPISVTVALDPIKNSYTTVYGYNANDTADPWKVYDKNAESWVNDLFNLEFGSGVRRTRARSDVQGGHADDGNARDVGSRRIAEGDAQSGELAVLAPDT